ncbi:hypothetical protein Cni_G05476 [Canna indica]|uniref:Protein DETOXIFICATION n=1 Tax=Canna indica TaxID=4628 RepID=A0AAQ3JUT8_9LILI|nr:hypothetical protein Cni_G05476 [Canna indica]
MEGGGERESLLARDDKSAPPLQDGEEGFGRRLLHENKKLWVVAGPSILTRFSSFGVTVISQAIVGHIGATELAAYAIVSTVFLRFANGVLVSAPTSSVTPLSLHLNFSLKFSDQSTARGPKALSIAS